MAAVSVSWMELGGRATVKQASGPIGGEGSAPAGSEARRAGSRGRLESDRPQATQVVAGDLASYLSADDVGETELDPFPDARR